MEGIGWNGEGCTVGAEWEGEERREEVGVRWGHNGKGVGLRRLFSLAVAGSAVLEPYLRARREEKIEYHSSALPTAAAARSVTLTWILASSIAVVRAICSRAWLSG